MSIEKNTIHLLQPFEVKDYTVSRINRIKDFETIGHKYRNNLE